MALFATVWPAAWFSTDTSGTSAVQGKTVANPRAAGPTIVMLATTARALSGMPLRPAIGTRTIPPAGRRVWPPSPIRVSTRRFGEIAVSGTPVGPRVVGAGCVVVGGAVVGGVVEI